MGFCVVGEDVWKVMVPVVELIFALSEPVEICNWVGWIV